MSVGWPDGAEAFVQAIADTKLLLSHRYAQWMLAAPVLEDDIAGASAAQDEMGHVRQLFRLLAEQGRDQDWLEGERDPDEFANAALLDEPMADWTEFLVRVNLTERASWYLLDAIDHDDFDGLVDRIGQDEYFHLDYLDARLRTVAAEDPGSVTEMLTSALPSTLAFLGPSTYDADEDPLMAEGFTDVAIGAIRGAYRDHYEAALDGTGVTLDGIDWTAPDPRDWNDQRRRVGDGTVDAETVRQLSGVESREYVIQ